MKLLLLRNWWAINANSAYLQFTSIKIRAGIYEIERISNPLFHNGKSWLVLKGTMIGASECYWRQRSPAVVVTEQIDLGTEAIRSATLGKMVTLPMSSICVVKVRATQSHTKK